MGETLAEDVVEISHWRDEKPELFAQVNPVLQILIMMVDDDNSVLSQLRGTPHLLQMIWNCIIGQWQRLIHKGRWCYSVDPYSLDFLRTCKTERGNLAFTQLGGIIDFPTPQQITVNMMPFVMERTFEGCRLPAYLKYYWREIINRDYYFGHNFIKMIPDSELGRIGFLTIVEGYANSAIVKPNLGLHTESRGKVVITPLLDGCYCNAIASDSKYDVEECIIGGGIGALTCGGCPCAHKELAGGIYTASNTSNSCMISDCVVLPDNEGREIIGELGNVEHLREYLPKGEMVQANRMYWLTDRTPHELLPVPSGVYVQYFRLVTSNLSVWFEDSSTANPLGVVPDTSVTKIVKGSMFSSDSADKDVVE